MMTNTVEEASSATGSMYGPGNVLGWYFMILACIVSWTVHPKRSRKDSIDADLVVTLTFPVFAVGQLIYLVQRASRLPWNLTMEPNHMPAVERRNLSVVAAIEAPLVIVEVFMNIAALMFTIAAVLSHARRALVSGFIGLLCYSADWYFHLSTAKRRGATGIFSRPFVANSLSALVLLAALLAILVVAASVLTAAFYMARRRFRVMREPERVQLHPTSHRYQASGSIDSNLVTPDQSSGTLLDDESSSHTEGTTRSPKFSNSNEILIISLLPLLFLPTSLFGSAFGMFFGQNIEYFPGSWAGFLNLEKTAPAWFFPHTTSSFSDLDQIMAIIAGGSVLAFNLCSSWRLRHKRAQMEEGREEEIRRRNHARMRRLLRNFGESDSDLEPDGAAGQRTRDGR